MTTTPQQAMGAILVSATTLYTAFIGSVTRAILVYLDLANTTAVDVTVNIWWESADGLTKRYIGQYSLTVPANGGASWRGIVTLANAGEKIRAQASAAGVDAVGTVMEQ